PIAAAPPPAGLRLAPWLHPRAHDAIWQADEAAFSDPRGYTPASFESFSQRLLGGHIPRQHSFLAWAGGVVAGARPNEMDQSRARGAAWVRQLFVRREWRSRGLGRALLEASLRRARELGYAQASLTVDAENLSGALKLYRAAGFEDIARRHNYQMQLTGDTVD